MNGIVLLMSMTMIGVDHGWQVGADGQVEYIVQIEPSLLDSLKGGMEIASEIRPEAGNVRRFRIRVGTGPLPQGGRQPASDRSSQAGTSATNSASPPGSAASGPSNSDAARSSASDNPRAIPLLNLPPPPSDLDTAGTASVLIRDRASVAEPPRSPIASPRNATGPLKDLPPPPSDATAVDTPAGQGNSWSAATEHSSAEETEQRTMGQLAREPADGSGPSSDTVPITGLGQSPRVEESEPPSDPINIWQPPSSLQPRNTPSQPIVTPLDEANVPAPIRDPDNARRDSSPSQPPTASLESPDEPVGGLRGLALNMDGQAEVAEPPSPIVEPSQGSATEPASEDVAAAQKPTLDEETIQRLADLEATKPWTPLVLTSLALFASLALNVYLGWIALGIYRKYRGMAMRLHQAQMA